MREILFRGKRTDNGEWVEGHIYEQQPPLRCVVSDKSEKSKWYILRTAFADWNMSRRIETIEVLPETVSQFTGCDNGEKFFENDIFKDGQDNIYTIRYSDYCFVADDGTYECRLFDVLDSYCTVIGNIFDNPEFFESEVSE
jgi:hypothetical protein